MEIVNNNNWKYQNLNENLHKIKISKNQIATPPWSTRYLWEKFSAFEAQKQSSSEMTKFWISEGTPVLICSVLFCSKTDGNRE